jgi:hypothetical protein
MPHTGIYIYPISTGKAESSQETLFELDQVQRLLLSLLSWFLDPGTMVQGVTDKPIRRAKMRGIRKTKRCVANLPHVSCENIDSKKKPGK